MQPRAALGVAIGAGLLAVAVVALDNAYGLEARLDARDANGEWFTVAKSPSGVGRGRYEEPYGAGGCARDELKLVVTNDKPFGDSVDVRLWFWNQSLGRDEFLLRETWNMDAFEWRDVAVTVPASALPRSEAPDVKPTAFVNARADEVRLGACVQAAEGS
jgi:hypothetical protein